MTSGSRLPSCKERETNKRRERRRRAIAAKIYAGLRMYGNYKLPKHCDNNEVLKALCREAGWAVEEDGTIYREGCKPVERMDVVGGSASPSPCSSYQPSPCASYNPSPVSSSIPSPKSSSHIAIASNANKGTDANSLIPWLKNLSSSASSSAASSKLPNYHHPYLHGGSISAPVTPPLSSPTARSPRIKTDWDNPTAQSSWSANHHTFLPSSTPPSPCRPVIPGSGWLAGIRIPTGSPSSPTFSLVSSNPFGPYKDASAGGDSSRMWTPGQSGTCSPVMPGGRSSRMWTPGQSGTCSPVMPGGPDRMDVHMSDGVSDEFAFGSSSNDNHQMMTGLVKAWEGERIHEECGSEELELTLGSSRTRSDA